MPDKNEYISEVELFVTDILYKLPPELCYHNLSHTKEVVKASELLALHSKLSPEEREILIISAWFHDAGHSKTYFGHETAGADLANQFLTEIDYPSQRIKEVLACILSTHYPPKPQNKLQKILCDADMYHLTLNDYEERSLKLKQEIESVTKCDIPLPAWCAKNIDFLNEHSYFSKYGKKLFGKLKEFNLNKFICKHCDS